MSSNNLSPPPVGHAHAGNLLHPGVRRDIADLNRLFLDRALDPGLRDDAWFQLPAATVGRLSVATAEALERAAGSPICLFELTIPGCDARPWGGGAVDDAVAGAAADILSESRRSFGLVALGVARRLSEGAPVDVTHRFRFWPAIESRLAALSPSAAYRLAAWPGLVQPRWHAHPRYWHLLAERPQVAAARSCTGPMPRGSACCRMRARAARGRTWTPAHAARAASTPAAGGRRHSLLRRGAAHYAALPLRTPVVPARHEGPVAAPASQDLPQWRAGAEGHRPGRRAGRFLRAARARTAPARRP